MQYLSYCSLNVSVSGLLLRSECIGIVAAGGFGTKEQSEDCLSDFSVINQRQHCVVDIVVRAVNFIVKNVIV